MFVSVLIMLNGEPDGGAEASLETARTVIVHTVYKTLSKECFSCSYKRFMDWSAELRRRLEWQVECCGGFKTRNNRQWVFLVWNAKLWRVEVRECRLWSIQGWE